MLRLMYIRCLLSNVVSAALLRPVLGEKPAVRTAGLPSSPADSAAGVQPMNAGKVSLMLCMLYSTCMLASAELLQLSPALETFLRRTAGLPLLQA